MGRIRNTAGGPSPVSTFSVVPLEQTSLRGLVGLVLAGVSLLAACTDHAPWLGQGTLGFACFPDSSCDPGLSCKAGRCAPNAGKAPEAAEALGRLAADSTAHGGTSDASLPNSAPQCDSPPGPAPVLDPIANTTAHPRATLHGRAPFGQRIVASVVGGANVQGTLENGAFCLEVPLLPEQVSRIELISYNAAGCASAATRLQLRHQLLPLGNVLAGVLPLGPGTVSERRRLTDGKRDDGATFTFLDTTAACDTFALLTFTFGTTAMVERVVVHYPRTITQTHFYLNCWSLQGSAEEKPPLDPRQWTRLAAATESAADTLTITLRAPQALRSLSLAMFESGDQDPYTETFTLSEVEAWARPPAPPFEGCAR